MIPFSSLNPTLQDVYFIFLTLVIVFTLFGFTELVCCKKRFIMILSVILLLCELLLLFLLLSGYIAKYHNYKAGAIYDFFYNLPVFINIIALTCFWCLLITLFVYGVRKKKRINFSSIKEAIDQLPVGLCFYKKNGLPILTNTVMNRISNELFSEGILNGNTFHTELSNGHFLSGNELISSDEQIIVKLKSGAVKIFKNRFLNDKDDTIELIAADITEEYSLNQSLSEEIKELENIKKRLLKYSADMVELTKEKEILSAKVRIHDELGRSLLALKKYLLYGGDLSEMQDIFEKWRRSSVLMGENEEITLEEIAKNIGVTLHMNCALPQNPELKEITVIAIKECLFNTVSHAKGNELNVCITEEDGKFIIQCTNNGKQPETEIVEGGGLSNLRKLVENYGGIMQIFVKPQFALKIELFKGNYGKN